MSPSCFRLTWLVVALTSSAATACGEDPEDSAPPAETDVDTDADADADTDADSDADTDTTPVSYSCLGCHQDENLLQATQDPEDTGDPGGESSGEG